MAGENKDEAAKSEEETKQVDDSKNADGSDKASVEDEKTETNPFEAELAKERERADKATQAAADLAFKLRGKKREGKADEDDKKDEEDEEDKPLTRREMDDLLAQERQKTRKELQARAITEIAKKLSKSEPEAQLIIEIHKNRTFPEGMSLDEQLEEAHAIANHRKMKAENDELRRKVGSKETATDSVVGTHKDPPAADIPKMSAKDTQALIAVGYKWDGKSQMFVKQLGNGKVLMHNPKTGQTIHTSK